MTAAEKKQASELELRKLQTLVSMIGRRISVCQLSYGIDWAVCGWMEGLSKGFYGVWTKRAHVVFRPEDVQEFGRWEDGAGPSEIRLRDQVTK